MASAAHISSPAAPRHNSQTQQSKRYTVHLILLFGSPAAPAAPPRCAPAAGTDCCHAASRRRHSRCGSQSGAAAVRRPRGGELRLGVLSAGPSQERLGSQQEHTNSHLCRSPNHETHRKAGPHLLLRPLLLGRLPLNHNDWQAAVAQPLQSLRGRQGRGGFEGRVSLPPTATPGASGGQASKQRHAPARPSHACPLAQASLRQQGSHARRTKHMAGQAHKTHGGAGAPAPHKHDKHAKDASPAQRPPSCTAPALRSAAAAPAAGPPATGVRGYVWLSVSEREWACVITRGGLANWLRRLVWADAGDATIRHAAVHQAHTCISQVDRSTAMAAPSTASMMAAWSAGAAPT